MHRCVKQVTKWKIGWPLGAAKAAEKVRGGLPGDEVLGVPETPAALNYITLVAVYQ